MSKFRTRVAAGVGLVLFKSASLASAAGVKTCPTTGICYSLSIPDTTASSGSGDIYFQLSAPTDYQYVALGQGSQMAGANIFVMYTSADGKNVTISPRLGTGHVQPQHDTSTHIELLEGSGVSNGVMTANVRCSDCNSWSGGSMDFSSSSADWIYAVKSGSSLNSDDLSENINMHDQASSFTWDLTQARGGSADVNPFVAASATTTLGTGTAAVTIPATCTPIKTSTFTAATGGGATATSSPSSGSATAASGSTSTSASTSTADSSPTGLPTGPFTGRPTFTGAPTGNPFGPPSLKEKRNDGCPPGYAPTTDATDPDSSSSGTATSGSSTSDSSSSGPSEALTHTVLLAHGTLASLAWVFLFPLGGTLIRILRSTNLFWIHTALQTFGILLYLAAACMGLWLATNWHAFHNPHVVIGIVLLIVMLAQPGLGWLHHKLYLKYGHRTLWSYVHIWQGRAAILLGMVNGGLGLHYAWNTPRSSFIVYGVFAGKIGVVYISSAIVGENRKKSKGLPEAEAVEAGRTQRMQAMSERSLSSDGEVAVQGKEEEYHGKAM